MSVNMAAEVKRANGGSVHGAGTNGSVPLPEEERFRKNLLELIGSLRQLVKYVGSHGFPVPNELIIVAGETVVATWKDTHELIKLMIDRSEKHWNVIHAKDEKFFISNARDVFKELASGDKVDLFGIIFNAKDKQDKYLVGPGNRTSVWAIVHGLVKSMIRYSSKYKIIPAERLQEHIKLWNIEIKA